MLRHILLRRSRPESEANGAAQGHRQRRESCRFSATTLLRAASVSKRVISVPLPASHSRMESRLRDPDQPAARRGAAQRAKTLSGVALQARRFLPARRIPQPDGLVPRARGQPPVREQREGGNPIRVAPQARCLLPTRRIPQPDGLVGRPRGQPPVGERRGGRRSNPCRPQGAPSLARSPYPTAGWSCRKSPRPAARRGAVRRAEDPMADPMALQARRLLPARHIPQPDGLVGRPRGQPPVGEQREGGDFTRVAL